MEQPLTYRWQNADNYFTAMLTPDLFGSWTLVTSSGSRVGKSGRVQQKVLASYEKGLDAIFQLRHRRRQEGYELCTTGYAEFQRFDPRSVDIRTAKTQAVLRLFDAWQLTRDEQACLLGIDIRSLEGYLDGRPLANDSVLLSRVANLLAINKVLRLRYGECPDFRREWLRLPNARMEGRSPLDIMMESRAGLVDLRKHLDQQAGQFRACCPGTRRQ